MKDARINIKVSAEWREQLRKGLNGMTMSAFVIRAVDEKLKRDRVERKAELVRLADVCMRERGEAFFTEAI